jgi:holo-[acyl-carrier protein] synthase
MLKDIFNSSEWDYALKKSNTAHTLTGVWCAKEAVVKTTSHKKEVFIIDIIIKHKKSRQTYVTFKKPSC